jgi:hypoxanthine phosphoribosyltransferase
MKRLLDFRTFEGIKREGDVFKMNFSEDSEGDIMSLKFLDRTPKRMQSGVTAYEYYYGYEFDSNVDKDFLASLKLMDEKISPNEAEMLVNKAVSGFDSSYSVSSYDTIVYPESSSKILKVLADKLYKKSGNSMKIPDIFVKSSRPEIKFDQEKIDGLPEKTKKEVTKVIDKIRNDEGTFKIHTVWGKYRKFIQEFMIFNKDQDRKVFNAITGKKVILVDDYRTSGTTLKEMLKSLFKLNPAEVTVFILINVKKIP